MVLICLLRCLDSKCGMVRTGSPPKLFHMLAQTTVGELTNLLGGKGTLPPTMLVLLLGIQFGGLGIVWSRRACSFLHGTPSCVCVCVCVSFKACQTRVPLKKTPASGCVLIELFFLLRKPTGYHGGPLVHRANAALFFKGMTSILNEHGARMHHEPLGF